MKNEATKRNDTTAGDEVKLVDYIAVLVRWRRLWISITIAGTAFGLALGLVGMLRGSVGPQMDVYKATTRSYLSDSSFAGRAMALAISQACADLVGVNLGTSAGDNYRKNATVDFDPDRNMLSISVKAESESAAINAAEAGSKAVSSLLEDSGHRRNRLIADALDDQASSLEAVAHSPFVPPLALEKLYFAAYAQSERIESEAYRNSLGPGFTQKDAAFIALDTLVRTRSVVERLALDAYAAALGSGDKAVRQEADGALAGEVSFMLKERAGLYRALISLPSVDLTIVGSNAVALAAVSFRSPVKTSVLWFILSLIVGIAAAFIVNAWQRLRNDPEAMEKLKDAVKRR